MTWIQTLSRRKFDYNNPTPESVRFVDISNSLSRQYRFLGHTISPYTVAQHSVLCSQHHFLQELPEEERNDAALCLLLHDAPEAYLGDMPKPLKDLLPSYKEIEQRVAHVIFKKFNILELMDKYQDLIKRVDLDMLLFEADELLQGGRLPTWELNQPPHARTSESLKPFICTPVSMAEALFTTTFLKLQRKRKDLETSNEYHEDMRELANVAMTDFLQKKRLPSLS